MSFLALGTVKSAMLVKRLCVKHDQLALALWVRLPPPSSFSCVSSSSSSSASSGSFCCSLLMGERGAGAPRAARTRRGGRGRWESSSRGL